jgi:hypothetical protein
VKLTSSFFGPNNNVNINDIVVCQVTMVFSFQFLGLINLSLILSIVIGNPCVCVFFWGGGEGARSVRNIQGSVEGTDWPWYRRDDGGKNEKPERGTCPSCMLS